MPERRIAGLKMQVLFHVNKIASVKQWRTVPLMGPHLSKTGAVLGPTMLGPRNPPRRDRKLQAWCQRCIGAYATADRQVWLVYRWLRC